MVQAQTQPLRVVGYARCSTAEQAADGLSLDAQEGRIRAWAQAVDAVVVDVSTDAGVSGTKALKDREGGARIAELLDARRPDVDAVVVLRLDRLGRNAAETLALLRRFRSAPVGLVSVADHIDLATPHGRAMAGISAVFAELERDLLSERTADALSELRSQGRVWNHPPFGWRVDDGRLVDDDEEQATLARMVQLRANGLGYGKIATTLTAEGRPTKRGGPWQAMSVRSILRTAESMATGTDI
jgi:site-specific DNA recombinase